MKEKKNNWVINHMPTYVPTPVEINAGADTTSFFGSTDLNDYKRSGFYRLGNSITNGPTTTGANSQSLIVVYGTDVTIQILLQHYTLNMYIRSGVITKDRKSVV